MEYMGGEVRGRVGREGLQTLKKGVGREEGGSRKGRRMWGKREGLTTQVRGKLEKCARGRWAAGVEGREGRRVEGREKRGEGGQKGRRERGERGERGKGSSERGARGQERSK